MAMLKHKKEVVNAGPNVSDEPPSFSKEAPSHIVDEHTTLVPERARLESLAKKLSAVFRQNPDVYEGSVEIVALGGKQYFVSSEGSASVQSASFVEIDVACGSQADDGMPIRDTSGWLVVSLDQLPPETELVAQVESLSRELSALRKAPVVERYAGPVLFSNIAAGEVVRALLVDNLVGTPPPKGENLSDKARRRGMRPSRDTELADEVGKQILPTGMSIVDDPTASLSGKHVLVAGRRFDAEGVAAEKVSLVENGTLRGFLMSRTPRKGFEHSNGHAAPKRHRADPSNLIVSSTKGLADAELRKRALLIQKALGYVLVVDKLDMRPMDLDLDVSAGSTFPKPMVMKRVYADGREELVRGAIFRDPPNFKTLVALGSTGTVYSWGGGEGPSGSVGAVAAPTLFFRDVTVTQNYDSRTQGPPIAPRPRLLSGGAIVEPRQK